MGVKGIWENIEENGANMVEEREKIKNSYWKEDES